MATKRALSVATDGAKWVCRSATLRLTDEGGEYNHPTIVLFGEWVVTEGHWPPSGNAEIMIRFQRNRWEPGDRDQPASFFMDTCRQWTRSYCGGIELTRDSQEIRLCANPWQMRELDRVAVTVAKRIARAREEYNLQHVSECECHQAVEALRKLGVRVEPRYLERGEWVHLNDITERYACERARRRHDEQTRPVAEQAT